MLRQWGTAAVGYGDVIKHSLQDLLNVQLSSIAYSQATLPVSFGGLGVRLASDLALPAFLSSVMSSSDMVQQLLPLRMQNVGGIHDVRHISTAGVLLPDQVIRKHGICRWSKWSSKQWWISHRTKPTELDLLWCHHDMLATSWMHFLVQLLALDWTTCH